jgi:hypothetical protein
MRVLTAALLMAALVGCGDTVPAVQDAVGTATIASTPIIPPLLVNASAPALVCAYLHCAP